MLPENNYSSDQRIEGILNLLVKYNVGDFSAREKISDKGDEIDAIIIALNTLGEELNTKSSQKIK